MLQDTIDAIFALSDALYLAEKGQLTFDAATLQFLNDTGQPNPHFNRVFIRALEATRDHPDETFLAHGLYNLLHPVKRYTLATSTLADRIGSKPTNPPAQP